MRFAFALYRYFPHGGLQCDMLRMAQEAVRRGHAVDIFCHQWRGSVPEKMNIVPLPAGGLTNQGKMASFGESFRSALAVRPPYDTVVTFNRIPGGDFYFAADNCLAVEWREKHSALQLKLNPRYRKFLEMEAQVMAQEKCRIFYIVDRQKEQYQQAYGLADDRFIYLPPGMNTAYLPPENAAEIRQKMRRELNVADDEIMLIQVGSDFFRKGNDRTLRTVASLPDNLRKKSKIFMIGSCKPGVCGKIAAKSGLSQQVFFTGGRDDVPAFLQAADLMIHPARSESAGNVIIESIVSGLPVVTSRVCGFWKYPAEVDPALVIGENFEQAKLDAAVLYALNNLGELKSKTIAYGAKADFCRRAQVAVDYMEKK